MSDSKDPTHDSDMDPPEEAVTPDTGEVDSDGTVLLDPEDLPAEVDPGATMILDPDDLPDYATDPNDPLVGTLMRDKWRVLERIGAGSFGTVYKVRDETGGWIEALKILSVDRMQGPEAENMRKRFLREAQIMKRLGKDSQYIVGLSTYEEDLEEGQIYFLMEYVEGRILSDVIREEGTFSVERAVHLGLQVCDALMAAHDGPEPVVHRDLKLENLMLTEDRNGEEMVKVLDFGIAKIAEREADSKLTTVGTLGTPGYAAPEQLRAGEVDGRTDLFAFGVILYSLLTGKNPWLGHLAHQSSKQTFELMAASDRADVLPISETGIMLPPDMVNLIMKLLQRDPDDRYQSARELREALLELNATQVGSTEGLTPTALIGTPTMPPPSTAGRRLAAVWFADIVGYSSLSSVDESAALELLKAFHKVGREAIEGGGGRVVQFIGDAVFAEFASTERAVLTAMDFYENFTAQHPDSEAEYDPELRIGVHVGDVHVAEDGDVFGDGVNTAARIQGAAEPGQILVSSAVWGQLKQRREFVFVSQGEHALKGLGSPMELYQVLNDRQATAAGIDRGNPTGTLDRLDTVTPGAGATKKSKMPLIAAGVVVLAGLGYAGVTVMGGGAADPIDAPPATTVAAQPEAGSGDESDEVGGDNGSDDAAQNGSAEAERPEPQEQVAATPPPVTNRPTPSQPAAEATPTAPDGFAFLRTNVETARVQARQVRHASLQDDLRDAEGAWTRAENAVASSEYGDATAALQEAERGFNAIITAGGELEGIERLRSELSGLRSQAGDAGLVSQANSAERTADQAINAGRLDQARTAFDGAISTLRRAADAAASAPEPEPIEPATVAADVLADLESAMEAEDLGRVRDIWTSISSEQASGLEAFFGGVSGLAVEYRVRSSSLRGETVIAVVETTYEFSEPGSPVSPPVLTFEMEESGGTWRIARSREGG